MMSLIANCRLTLGMRYHFCLFSALQDVPFVALQRSDKVADLCWDLDGRLAPASTGSGSTIELIGRGSRGRTPRGGESVRRPHPGAGQRARRNALALELLRILECARRVTPDGRVSRRVTSER